MNKEVRREMEKENEQVKVGIQGYEIKQGLDDAKMTLSLIFSNPNGDCKSYSDFLGKFNSFLRDNGYSF